MSPTGIKSTGNPQEWPRGRETPRGVGSTGRTAAVSGRRACYRRRDPGAHRRNRERAGAGSRHTRGGREAWTRSRRATWAFLLLLCLFLLLLHDLRVPLLAGGGRKPVISALSFNRLAWLSHVLRAGELALALATAPAGLRGVPSFSTTLQATPPPHAFKQS